MHPVEHLIYFSGAAIHFVLPSHPLHALFHLTLSTLSPARSHSGFERLVIGSKSFPIRSQMHYYHHKYFECNYSSGPIPLDKWAGTFHDGTEVAQAKMNERFMAQQQGAD
jgi:sterol desaturase/sphingolipid hydroxylase (fatty acid hydroxylase superfamily)